MLAAPHGAEAQRRSQFGTVMQQIHDTVEVTVEYSRPVARGRALFGELVAWDEIWTPGANKATNLILSHDLRVGGTPVPAGRYSVWLIPRREGPWTLILNRTSETWHFRYPGKDQEQARIDVWPEAAEHMEVLAFYFPLVTDDGATLVMHWGTKRVPILLELGG